MICIYPNGELEEEAKVTMQKYNIIIKTEMHIYVQQSILDVCSKIQISLQIITHK
jgi:hypothetical protein